MSPERTCQIEVLRLLTECGDYQMPENAVVSQLYSRLRPPPTTAEIRGAIRTLETNMKITGIRTDDGVKYSITARGKADLYEHEHV